MYVKSVKFIDTKGEQFTVGLVHPSGQYGWGEVHTSLKSKQQFQARIIKPVGEDLLVDFEGLMRGVIRAKDMHGIKAVSKTCLFFS